MTIANKIPLLYDEGSDVAREVVSEVEINRMGISRSKRAVFDS